MKKTPDILELDEWTSLWEPWEIIDDANEFESSIKCPSCNGTGSITLEHSFKDENGDWDTNEYVVDCEYCEGDGTIPIPHDRISTYKLADMYKNQVKKDVEKYNNYYKMINHEN